MEHEFWYNAWAKDKQGWNQASVNTHLKVYWKQFSEGNIGDCVFVPLCGQSIDMLWLTDQGHSVVGVELDHGSVEKFFNQHKLAYTQIQSSSFQTLNANKLAVHTGDYYDLTSSHLDSVKLVYDRAALIALPEEMRKSYVDKLRQILNVGSKILLIAMVYDENEMSGPPFSVADKEVFELYSEGFDVEKIATSSDPMLLGGLSKRGLTKLTENIFIIKRV